MDDQSKTNKLTANTTSAVHLFDVIISVVFVKMKSFSSPILIDRAIGL